jgi:hypothetical protein
MDVIPLPTTSPDGASSTTCAGCGAPLAPDQRYCLACGRPCSPVRLAFLDVLQADHHSAGVGGPPDLYAGGAHAGGYAPAPEPAGALASLRRYSGLFGLLGVLLASLLIGLLVGHWITGTGSSAGKQVVEVKGLSGALAAAPAAGVGGTSTGAGSSSGAAGSTTTHDSSTNHGSTTASGTAQSHSASASESGAEEAEAAKEVKTTKPLPAAHKTSAATLQKLEHTTGKQHEKEVNAALGEGPIETGH